MSEQTMAAGKAMADAMGEIRDLRHGSRQINFNFILKVNLNLTLN